MKAFSASAWVERHEHAVRAALEAHAPTPRMLEGIGHPLVPSSVAPVALVLLVHNPTSRTGAPFVRWIERIEELVRANDLGTPQGAPSSASQAHPVVYVTGLRLFLLVASGELGELENALVATRTWTTRVLAQPFHVHEGRGALRTLPTA